MLGFKRSANATITISGIELVHQIRKDSLMRQTYKRIKIRAGGKRAIVAVARKLLLRSCRAPCRTG
jgi:hypothetical protein